MNCLEQKCVLEWKEWTKHLQTNTTFDIQEMAHCDACHVIHKFRNVCQICNQPVCVLCIDDFDGNVCVICKPDHTVSDHTPLTQQNSGCAQNFEYCQRMTNWLFPNGEGRHCDACHAIEYQGVNEECPGCKSWQCGVCDYENGCKCA